MNDIIQPRLIQAPIVEQRNKNKKRYWLTPPELMAELNARFDFDYDPCPNPRPDNYDGLEADWGQMNWVNPPFTKCMRWAKKALAEREKGKSSVMVLPIYQSRVVAYLAEQGAMIEYLGQPRWLSIEDHEPSPAKLRDIPPCLLLILRG